MKKITKRDVLFILLGIFIMLVIESALDWDNSVKAFNTGLNADQQKAEKEQVK